MDYTFGQWSLIKRTDAVRADEMIDLFSDMVLERVLKNIKTLEFKTPDKWYVFRYNEHDAVCILLESDDASTTNLVETPFNELFGSEEHIKNINLSRLQKPHKKAREEEIFNLMNNGGTIAADQLFDAFADFEAKK